MKNKKPFPTKQSKLKKSPSQEKNKKQKTERCDVCQFEEVIEHHCKIICPRCGATRDCSDP